MRTRKSANLINRFIFCQYFVFMLLRYLLSSSECVKIASMTFAPSGGKIALFFGFAGSRLKHVRIQAELMERYIHLMLGGFRPQW